MWKQSTIIGMHVFAFALALTGCDPDDPDEGDDQGDKEDPDIPTCEYVDDWEPNSSPDKPSMMTWQSADEWVANLQIDDAGLCAGEDDWYHVDVGSLGYTEHYLYIRALVKDAGLCGLICDAPVIPAGPRHAMTVEVYRADDMLLLTSVTQDDGVLAINGTGGDPYAHELLIRVYSPTPTAEYPYRLSIEVRNYDGEDECEC